MNPLFPPLIFHFSLSGNDDWSGRIATYLKRHPPPAKKLPVVTVRVEARLSSLEARDAKAAEFEVIVANIGSAPASGALRLIAGPKKSVRFPSLRRLTYSLSPPARKPAKP